jgi:hypothetical protein
METSSRVMARVDELIALFNRRSEDLPDQLFDRRTQFVLNGVPFEASLGRSPADPLVLMLTRGVAGYRLAAKGMLHAVPDARVERGDFALDARGTALRWQCWLSGHLRGTGQPLEAMFDAEFVLAAGGTVMRAAVFIAESQLEAIRAARLRT